MNKKLYFAINSLDGAPPKFRVNNTAGDPQKATSQVNLQIDKNTIRDEGNGKIRFSKPVTITDNNPQWNGTQYDISSLDIAGYRGKLTADHKDSIESILGNVIGVKKVANKRVTIDGIEFAVEKSALARFAHGMMMDGWLTDLSIETIGPYPDDNGVYHDAKLVGLSMVVVGNNKQAYINQLALNTIKSCEAEGIDASAIKELAKYPIDNTNSISDNDLDMLIRVVNTKSFDITVTFKNDKGEAQTKTLKANEFVDVLEAEANGVTKQITDAVEPKKDDTAKQTQTVTIDAAGVGEIVKSAIADATKPLLDKVADLEKQVFDNNVKEPVFTKADAPKTVNTQTVKDLDTYGYRERAAMQINLAWEALQNKNQESARKLKTINEYHLEKLKEAKKVDNAITIADFGSFVISPELLSEIEGFRSDFKPLISKLNFRETLSTKMAWLSRNGDIDMTEVAFCDDGSNGNLKPVKEYDALYNETNLQELAAVTPVCNAATRFLAVDLISDIAEGYRTDYDRKKSQLFIARLQQAVDNTGLTRAYIGTTDTRALQAFIDVASLMQENVMGGYYILSQKSYWELMRRQTGAGINTETGFKLFTTGDAGPLFLGSPYIIVPNELLPTWNTSETRSFVVDGVTVTINQAIFFVDISTFSGRTSGGLNYDFSTEAAYEVGGVVKSAYQRNELVVRGSFFRGGAVRNEDKVVGLAAAGLS